MTTDPVYTLTELLGDFNANGLEPNAAIYEYLAKPDLERLKLWKRRLDRVRSYKTTKKGKAAARVRGRQSKLVGQIFERFVGVLLDGCLVLKHDGNVQTTNAEIDFLMSLKPMSSLVPCLRGAGSHILGEAKCTTKPLKTEWVHKLSGIMGTTKTSIAILFTAGPPKKLHADHRSALSVQSAGGKVIVPFGTTQVESICGGANFLEVLGQQYVKVCMHVPEIHI